MHVIQVSRRRFDELVAAALDALPEEFAREMHNVAVVVEDWPRGEGAETHGRRLLGLYEGVPLTRRGPLSYSGATPDRITIFRGPLSASAYDEDDLTARVRTTVFHEVGHYFGLSDERLAELGWA